MTRDLDPIKLSNKIIEIYERYLENPNDEDNKDWALSINIDYVFVADFVDRRLARAISELVYLVIDGPQRYTPSPEQITNYIKDLRQLISELENKQ